MMWQLLSVPMTGSLKLKGIIQKRQDDGLYLLAVIPALYLFDSGKDNSQGQRI
jgi:hypothetical protein